VRLAVTAVLWLYSFSVTAVVLDVFNVVAFVFVAPVVYCLLLFLLLLPVAPISFLCPVVLHSPNAAN
jgi:hypothetical protein